MRNTRPERRVDAVDIAGQAKEARMKRTMLALTLALSAAVAPSAAGAVVIISSEGVEGPYSHLEYSAAADGKEFLVEVRGNPFPGMSQEAFNQALMNVLMATRPARPAAQFTTKPVSANFDPSYRLVIVFGPARNLAFETQCRSIDKVGFAPVSAGEVKVSAAFCRKDDLMSRAIARTSATSVDDPAFREMFAQLFPVLFPLRNPFMDGDDRRHRHRH
jgi:hypothetical protein